MLGRAGSLVWRAILAPHLAELFRRLTRFPMLGRYISVDEEDAGASLPLLHALNARAGRALRSGRRSADAPLDRVQCPHPTVCDSEKRLCD